MPVKFNANEIFEMAEEIEANAEKFYREAADNTSDKNTEKMLLEMAEMEDEHLNIFRQMRQSLGEEEQIQPTFDPEDEAALYLQAMADAHGSEGKISPTKKLTGNETIKEILHIAKNAEKDSVVFYNSLKEMVPPRAGRGRVEKIIKEEIGHINTINQKLNEAG